MEDKTTEFSFILKPSKHGVGVFSTHDIKEGTYLRLFKMGPETGYRKKEEIPKLFQGYCVDRGDMVHTPKDFGRMEIGWYVNHSKEPNAAHTNYDYYATRDIKEGEEITIDYNTLEEPEEAKESYY